MRFVGTPMSLVGTRQSVVDTLLSEIWTLSWFVGAPLRFAVTDKALTIARHRDSGAPFDDEGGLLCWIPEGKR
jgi:hypothetical protein